MVDKIRSVVAGPIEGAGYELLEVEWKREAGGWVCRLFVDNPTGAFSLDDCERVSRMLSPVLDVADIITQAYSLEVSSPGVDRPLRTTTHFKRFVGERAKVKLLHGVDGRRNFTGTIIEVPDDEPPRVVIEVDDKQRFTLPLSDLERANLIYDFSKDLAQHGASTAE
jgi:ribosome maturation factor RimP